MKVIKCNYNYYYDDIHKMGLIKCDKFYVKSYLAEGEHFIITIDNGKIKCEFTNVEPMYNKNEFGEGTYYLEEIELEEIWIKNCYEFWLKNQELNEIQQNLITTKPIIVSMYDEINRKFDSATMKFKSNDFIEAKNILEDIYYNYNTHDLIKTSAYNIACCYGKLNDPENASVWLSNAVIKGYDDWTHIILDNDFETIKYNKNFVNVIMEMIKKNSFNPNRDHIKVRTYLETIKNLYGR